MVKAQTSAQIIPLNAPSQMAVWPVPGDAPNLRTIVQDQATVIKDQAALIAAYQANLNLVQTPPTLRPAAFGNGTSSGTPATTLTTTAVSGVIAVPSRVTGPGVVTSPTNVIAQVSGAPGGAGVYTTDNAMTASSAALTFIPAAQPTSWPVPNDAPTLTTVQQDQTAILRTQTALLQQYQDLLNDSQTPAPPTGP